MKKQKPCCGNCDGKTEKISNNKSIYLFCDTKKKNVNPDGLCQWHDYARKNNIRGSF